MGDKCAKLPPACRSIHSWSKRIAPTSRPSRSAGNGANRLTPGSWPRKSRGLAASRSKKLLAQRQRLRDNSFDLIVGRITRGNSWFSVGSRSSAVLWGHGFLGAIVLFLGSCAAPQDTAHRVIVSTREQ